MNNLRILSYVGFIRGLSAAVLESQYFDEFLKLSKYVENLLIISGDVSMNDNLPRNFEIYKVGISKIPKIRGLTKLIQYSKAPFNLKNKFNFLYVRTLSPSDVLSFWIVKTILKIPGVVLLGGSCFYEPITFKNRIYRWILSHALESADKILVNTDKQIPFVLKLNPKISNKKFEVIRNAVDHNRFKPSTKNVNLLKKIDINEDEKIIIFVGTITSSRKGVTEILRTASILKDEKIKILLIGTINKKSIEYKKIQDLMNLFDLHKKIIFLEKIPNNEIPEYLSLADVCLYLSKGCESIPRAVLEAMACGVPIIGTPVVGIPDMVINGKTGFLVHDYEEAAEKTIFLLSKPDLINEMKINCRQKALNEFIYDVTLPKMVNIFESIVKSKNSNHK